MRLHSIVEYYFSCSHKLSKYYCMFQYFHSSAFYLFLTFWVSILRQIIENSPTLSCVASDTFQNATLKQFLFCGWYVVVYYVVTIILIVFLQKMKYNTCHVKEPIYPIQVPHCKSHKKIHSTLDCWLKIHPKFCECPQICLKYSNLYCKYLKVCKSGLTSTVMSL